MVRLLSRWAVAAHHLDCWAAILMAGSVPAPSARKAIRAEVLLVGAAAAWGLILLILALVVPIVTLPGPPVPAPPAPSAAAIHLVDAAILHELPRVTLVSYYGYQVLALVALPALISLAVGLLLWIRATRQSRWAGRLAWVASVAVLVGGVVGFVTFLIGLAAVPTGVLLVIACARRGPAEASN